MQIIGLRLTENMEVERYLHRGHTPSPQEKAYPGFPYISYELDFETYLEDRTPFHQHKEFEFLVVTSGSITIRSSKSSYILSTGECCLVNVSTLHAVAPEPAGSHATVDVHLFYPDIITGTWGTVFDSRYVSPVLESRDLDLFYFSHQNKYTADVVRYLDAAKEASEGQQPGYELDVRAYFSLLWKKVFQDIKPHLGQRRTLNDRNEERMQIMLLYIRKNYQSHIDLADIAASAMISERECFRCFQNTLGISPTRYLQNYRIRMAARRLLESDDTIQSISEAVGFNDHSYFGRIFQKHMHCTPTEFRKKIR